jgi:predicted GTPase
MSSPFIGIISDQHRQQSIQNVIVFGETGAGKSSVVNMILGCNKAKVGDGALGETFRSTIYPVEIDGKTYNLHDTVGLGEYSGGTVDSAKAAGNLYRLMKDLSNSGGVNLLIFVIKRGRLTETIHKNYVLFHRGFCDSQVPIVVIVTGCENVEPTMDAWWIDNKRTFTEAGMLFAGHACVCAFKGRKTENGGHRNEDLVNESVEVVKQLVVQRCMAIGWEKVSDNIILVDITERFPI